MKQVSDKEMEIKAKKKKKVFFDWSTNQNSLLFFKFQIGEKAPELNFTSYESTELDGDVGSNNSGWYSLKGVLTHKGRSIDAGHYIGWTKHGNNWCKFDDDKVYYIRDTTCSKGRVAAL